MVPFAPAERKDTAVESLKIPPHSTDAEQAVLGGLMLENTAWDQVTERVSTDDFYHGAHRTIFSAIHELAERDSPFDVVTLKEWLDSHKLLDSVGGMPYLAVLARDTPSAANVRAYADIVRERAVLRRLIQVGSEIANSAYNPEGRESRELIDQAEQRVFAIANTGARHVAGFVGINELLTKAVDRIDTLFQLDNPVTGMPTGWTDFDEMTAGLQRGDLVIVAGRPSMGKCLAHDAELVLDDGSLVTMAEMYRRQSGKIGTLTAAMKIETAEPCHYLDDGEKPVFEVRTALGRRVETTLTHPFRTLNGWKPLAELDQGELIAVPRRLPFFGDRSMRDCEIKLLAYLIGDGGLTGTTPKFTSTSRAVQADFATAVAEFGGLALRPIRSPNRAPSFAVTTDHAGTPSGREVFAARLNEAIGISGRSARVIAADAGVAPSSLSYWRQGVSMPDAVRLARLCEVLRVDPQALSGENPDSARRNRPNPLTLWLREMRVYGKGAGQKQVPAAVFRLKPDLLALFLNRLFATDGWASVYASGQSQIGYASVSETLAQQVQHLLLRFGILARLRQRWIRYRDARRPSWQLEITHAESILEFVEKIGIFGKELQLEKVRLAVESSESLESDELLALTQSDVYWDRIDSITALGRKQVYDLTIPETHNFVANDICVHNTTFAMNIAEYVAIQVREPVAVFSMEMPGEQLAMRMMSSLGRIDQHRIRTGKLEDDDWPRLTSAITMLNEARLFIDDSSDISPSELRTRARRLAREHGQLGLVIVDYIQLMRVAGFNENRTQEVAEISRSLKALAKELSVPVVALSQLNRSLEQRADKRPVMSDLRECVTGDTLVQLTDGRRIPIRELVDRQPEVWAMSEDHRLVAAQSDKVWSVGERPVFRISLASGHTLRVTARHRLYSGRGWVHAEDLNRGDRLALARRIPEPNHSIEWSDHAVILLGHLVGDGSYLSGQPMRYTTASEENSAAVADAARAFDSTVNRHPGRGNWHQLVISGNGNRWHPQGVGKWLKEIGIHGQRSHEKRLPTEVFRLGNRQVALLLRHLWATDGCIALRNPEKPSRGAPRVYFSTCSPGLATDVAALLLRFGIVARLRKVVSSNARPVYTVDVSGTEQQRLFLKHIGAFGPRFAPAERLAAYLLSINSNPNIDTMPRELFEHVRSEMALQGISHRRMAAMRGTAYGGSSHFSFAPSRKVLLEYANLLDDDYLRSYCSEHLFWDQVVTIAPDGVEEVFDLTVPGPASWIANGVISHNSGAIEQDADLICFIYRDEVYHPDSPHKGIAEVIIGKQRNGPIGAVKLTFLGQFTSFQNFAPESYGDSYS